MSLIFPQRRPDLSARGRRRTLAVLGAICLAVSGCASQSASTTVDGTSTAKGSTSSTASKAASASTSASSTTPTPTPTATTRTVGYPGVGQPVTQPSCPTPPAQGTPLKATGTVVPNLPALEPGTNHGTTADSYAYPAATVHRWMLEPSTQPKNKKIAFLTFDDGPSDRTPEVLAGLKATGGHATFFNISREEVGVDKSLLNEILADGNAIAVHSFSHDYNYLYPGRWASASHIGCDIDYAVAQMRSVIGSGYTTGAIRNPGGHMSWNGWKKADPAMTERHMSWIDWNSLSKDAEGKPLTSVDEAVANIKSTAAEYGTPNVLVILNHDAPDKKITAKAVPAMVKYLKSQGYELGVIA